MSTREIQIYWYKITYDNGRYCDTVETTIDPLEIHKLGYFSDGKLFIPLHSIKFIIKIIP